MKIVYCVICLIFIGQLAKAQGGGSEVSLLKESIAPDLAEKINAIPINEHAFTIKKFAEKRNSSFQKTELTFYSFKLLKNRSKNFIKVNTKPITQAPSAETQNIITNEHTFYVLVSYICTDQNHAPVHSAPTLEGIKTIQAVRHCSGIRMLIHN